MVPPSPLPVEALARLTDPATLAFETTDDLAPIEDVIGQDRAVEAVRFGISIRQEGYNLFALGPSGVGKHSLVRRFLERRAPDEPTPPDWVYVHNFDAPHRPNAMPLPAGRGRRLRDDMDRLVDDLRTAIPAVFEGDEYRTRRQSLEQQMRERHEEGFEDVQRRAREKGVAMMRTPMGIALAPIRNGEPLGPDEFEKLDPAEQERIKRDIEELQQELEAALRRVPQLQRESRDQLRNLNREAIRNAVSHLIEDVKQRHGDVDEVVHYLDAVREDMVESGEEFLRAVTAAEGGPPMLPFAMPGMPPGGVAETLLSRYRVNLLVDHAEAAGAPIVHEDHPTHPNLVGRIEHRPHFGALVTDFTLIKAGALHRANGGYLILDARRLLAQPLAWEELKRTLRAREIRIESLGQALSLISTVSLEPEPIPLDVKVVLLGEQWLYYLLSMLDPEFAELFKVQADFDDRMVRDERTTPEYARLIATLARDAKLRPFGRAAVARVMDRAARLAEDAERLSTHLSEIGDLLREADYWAGENGHEVVTDHDVQQAIDAAIHRADRLRERALEAIDRGMILIDTKGAVTGQINGLAVSMFGGFGRPSRLTARVALGRGEVVDIEREVALGGPIHSKGVLILQGFLAARYAQERPLSLKASLVFEQSYGGVDGDSASSAELYALLSALADVPIRQGLAVTGSVNQRGQVQAIGGANEKIEGHFDVCKARGLTGEEGVLIPSANIKNLMLRRDVIDAASEGRFRIYAVETIDQGIEILTGMPAGERDADGRYPEDSINGRVERRLAGFAEAARRFAQLGRGSGERERAPGPGPAAPEDRL
jgi:lon-related putative ATP-dependent protease